MSEEKEEAVKKREFALFKRASDSDQDPVLTILRVHLLTEYYLERIIHIYLSRGDRLLDDGNLSYFDKLTVVSGFDLLNDRIIQCLKRLNTLRNQCAHELDKQISIPEVESFGRSLGSKCVRFRQESGDSVGLFLHEICSHVCGYLAGTVMMLEAEKIQESEKK